jgi:hypothetical protein
VLLGLVVRTGGSQPTTSWARQSRTQAAAVSRAVR